LIAGYSIKFEEARPYFTEAIGLARALDDRWRLSQILAYQSYSAIVAGDMATARVAAEEGRDLAHAIGDWSESLECVAGLGWARLMQGEVVGAIAQFRDALAEIEAAHALQVKPTVLHGLAAALAHHGDTDAGRAAAEACLEA